jgi:hypothetical protein
MIAAGALGATAADASTHPRRRRRGEMSRQLAPDGVYFVTTFETEPGGSEPLGCLHGQQADGSWHYAAGSQRWGCGARLRLTNPLNGASCVVQVADAGPAAWVEDMAGGPVVDVSPLTSQELFGSRSSGWSDRRRVHVEVVDGSTPLGPT